MHFQSAEELADHLMCHELGEGEAEVRPIRRVPRAISPEEFPLLGGRGRARRGQEVGYVRDIEQEIG